MVSPRKLDPKKLERIVEMANVGIWTVDANGLTDFINERGAAILGYAPDEMLGLPVTDFIFPEDEGSKIVPKGDRQVSYERLEIRGRRKDGSAVWVSSSTSPILGDDGIYQGALSIFADISERKEAEMETQREHRQLLSIFDAMDEPVYVADPESYELLYTNDAFRRLWGSGKGRRCYSALQNRNEPCPFCTNKYIFNENLGKTYIWEFQNERTQRWYKCIDRSIRWPDGRNVRFEMAIDVTEVRDGVDAVKAERDRLSSLISSMSDEVWFVDAQGKLVLINPAAAREFRLELTPEEMSVEDVASSFEVYRPDGTRRPPEEAPPLRALRGELVKNQEEIVRTPYHNELRHRQVNAAPVNNSSGKIVGAIAVVRDITDRTRAEEALRENETLLRGVITNLPIVLWTTDIYGIFTLSEGKGLETLGLKPGEVVGRSTFELYSEHPIIIDAMMKALSGTESLWQDDIGGTTFKAWTVPLRDKCGAVSGALGVAADITEQKALEKELKRSNAELQQFAYVTSHDLREPLRMITSYLDLLQERYKGRTLDAKAEEYIEIICSGAVRMQQMISDLLAYSRIEKGEASFTLVDMEEVLSVVKKNLDLNIKENDVTITNDPLPVIEADPSQMVSLLQNLISNAIKFRGPKPPIINVSTVVGMNEWKFSVKDNGIGVDPTYQDSLFRLFHRLHTHEAYPGTGIGLAIAKKIIERHGGRIWVESDGKNGSTFYFTIQKT